MFFKGKNHEAQAYGKKEKPILCLTTLHHRRYVEDIIHSIGLPIGSHVRLRYRKLYVCPILWAEVDSNETVSSRNVLIALAGKNSVGTTEVVPIRKGKVFKASCQGELLILDVVLGNYVFSSSANSVDVLALLRSRTTSFPSFVSGNQNSPNIYLQRLAAPIPELKSNPSVLGWERVASSFFKVDTAQGGNELNAPFLYHINKLQRGVQAKLERSGKLKVAMGKQLELEIHTIARASSEAIKNPLGEVVLDLSHSAASFISSRRVRADSSRDIKSIGIITTPLFSAADGHLSIRTCIFKPKAPAPAPAPPAAIAAPVPGAQSLATSVVLTSNGNQDMLSADKRTEIIVARYDFPLRVGGYRPWLACWLIAVAAALSVFKMSASGEFKKIDLIVPGIVFVLTFFGLKFGIIKK